LWTVEEAVEALKSGVPVLIHDSSARENEVDMVFYGGQIDKEKVYMLRTRAGGVICHATTSDIMEALGLVFLDELLARAGRPYKSLASRKLSYGDRPAFVLWVNHASARTGVTDEDRALTISGLHRVVRAAWRGDTDEARRIFEEEFQAPGHVAFLASRGLSRRRGHTELAVSLALLAGLEPSVVFAEMLARGTRLSLEDAEALSEREGWPLLRGDQIVGACSDAGIQVCWSH
jgi:3,4-dihydroxy 2-butanone 4-phosphate synthase